VSHLSVADLFRAYHRELVRFATRLVGDRALGEEIAQDTYLKLVGGKVQVAAIAAPKTYLFRAAQHVAYDARARRRVEWRNRVDAADLTDIADPAADPSVIQYHRQCLRLLANTLNELSENCRTAFFLNRVGGLTHAEIAARLGISVSAVEKHVVRAFVRCRDRMTAAEIFSALR
jgi:RNA polymerase sigma factor (sigma-70 family)